MAEAVVDNIYLVNSPAGSGKTTKIKSMIIKHTIEYPNDNILCITYTNRAADELRKGLSSDKVYCGTIHSFLHDFIRIYFSHPQVINLYFEIYGEDIKKRILNGENDEKIAKSNIKYMSKYNDLSYDIVQKNIKSIYYNETQFTSLYYGGLSHNDLILFAKEIFDRFPIVKKRLTQKYQIIFVDEYQDSSANVLKIFYDAVCGTSAKLYFLGDKMQQIYRNYDGSFEKKLIMLNRNIALDTNHRSIPQIIDILNNIYNDESYRQKPSQKNINIRSDLDPRVLICDNVVEKVESESLNYPDALLLFLLNKKKFESLGAGNLYRQVSKMEKYSFISQYSAVDILVDNTEENPDPLFRVLFLLNQIDDYFEIMNLGSIIQLLRKNEKIFDKEVFSVKNHQDKERLRNLLKSVLYKYKDFDQQYEINDVINILKVSGLVKSKYIEDIIEGGEYSGVLTVNINEFRALTEYIKTPNISTQHGVKGESHDTVFFIAEDSTSAPVVHMYNFFKLWSNTDISLKSFENFYYEYMKWINNTHNQLGFKLSAINKELHNQHCNYLKIKVEELLEHFKENAIFKQLCEQTYIDYLLNPNVTNAKKCFRETQVYGSLCAYRLFYVGCSRAKRNLTIFIDKSKVNDFYTPLKNKFEVTGFKVYE